MRAETLGDEAGTPGTNPTVRRYTVGRLGRLLSLAMGTAAIESSPMRVLDLFCGAGGLTQGFHSTGRYRTVEAVEIDPDAAASFAATFGKGIVYVGSIHDWLKSEPADSIDIVVGGPPCQGFSTLGRQDAEDQRNLLWRDYARTIRRVRPRYFVLENVARFLDSAQYRALQRATRRNGLLRDYQVVAGVLNAADYGAAQARRRAILIGSRRDQAPAGLPTPTHEGTHVTLHTALKWVRRGVTAVELPDRVVDVAGRPRPGAFKTRELHVGRSYSPISLARIRSIPGGGNRFDIPVALQPRCWRDHLSGSMDVMGRLEWDRPAVTIRTEFFKPEKGRYLHPTENRAITHYEAARIQGFPEDHRWVGSKTAIGQQIGNAVPIPLAAAIGRHLAECADA
jgi:DNA (cytosine-5)-methyltransferase 1